MKTNRAPSSPAASPVSIRHVGLWFFSHSLAVRQPAGCHKGRPNRHTYFTSTSSTSTASGDDLHPPCKQLHLQQRTTRPLWDGAGHRRSVDPHIRNPDVVRFRKLSVSSGAFIWGPVVFITAGCLTAAAGMSPSSLLIKLAEGFNIFAALTAIATVCIFVLDTSGVMITTWPPVGNNFPDEAPYSGIASILCFVEFTSCMQVSFGLCRDCCNLRGQRPPAYSSIVSHCHEVSTSEPPSLCVDLEHKYD
ncbi:membrane-spanning 4-domains, subfamily A, member 17A.1 [Anoplopoma fimbria]|uniref:membrane-spanning 4-domains, subfamily A, member 17A.1 n=1 Tax=Anoplopoma fimbria TaxID=229290 RepID=UPI0023ED7546|nr:membrane-spanning 4-domains, subfamily A, member 17A.1 [Anoplopoma fimbria]